jgi:hypothetical protein
MAKRRGYTEQASRQLDGEPGWPRPDGKSQAPSPFAVICRTHGQVYITEDDYVKQLSMPDALWTCPECGGVAEFDDDNYEYWTEEGEPDE